MLLLGQIGQTAT
jgi:hypothetical protein